MQSRSASAKLTKFVGEQLRKLSVYKPNFCYRPRNRTYYFHGHLSFWQQGRGVVCLFPACITGHMTRGSVCLQGGLHPGGRLPPDTTGYGQQAGGMHPIWMLSCTTRIRSLSVIHTCLSFCPQRIQPSHNAMGMHPHMDTPPPPPPRRQTVNIRAVAYLLPTA